MSCTTELRDIEHQPGTEYCCAGISLRGAATAEGALSIPLFCRPVDACSSGACKTLEARQGTKISSGVRRSDSCLASLRVKKLL